MFFASGMRVSARLEHAEKLLFLSLKQQNFYFVSCVCKRYDSPEAFRHSKVEEDKAKRKCDKDVMR